MWINNSIIEKQINENDEIPINFKKGRLPKPKKITLLVQKISKQQLIDYYIIKNNSFLNTLEFFNLKNRSELRQLLKHYKITKDKSMASKYRKQRSHQSYVQGGKKSSETQKNNWKNKSIEEKQKYKNKQKIAHSTQHFRQLIKEINIQYNKNLDQETKQKRNKCRSESCKNTWKNNKQLIAKQRLTAKQNRIKRKQNNEICKSIKQQKIYQALKSKNYTVEYDVYVDDRYPYYVDFYIKQIDLFIQYQGHPSHGNYPYIQGDKISLNQANRLYGDWRNIYVVLDKKKKDVADQSKINFIRIYPNISLQENNRINDYKFLDIIEIVYNAH